MARGNDSDRYVVPIVFDTEGRALPTRAWLTDPARPNGDPRVTYVELASGLAAERLRS